MAEDIISKAKELVRNHKDEGFNINYVSDKTLQLIARRFNEHKRSNVEAITNIKKAVSYMIAAKLVGDRRLYRELNELTGNVFDSYCDSIDVIDDCQDGFDTAIERHVCHANERVYTLLKSKHIKYLDAGLIHGVTRDIFLPAYNATLSIYDNIRCYNEVDKFIKNTPEEDKHNNSNDVYTKHVVKELVVFNDHLYMSDKDSDSVEFKDSIINEYIVDSQLDPDVIKFKKFAISGNAGGSGMISLQRPISIKNLKNFDKILIQDGYVYHNETRHCYIIAGNYNLIHLVKYDDLFNMSLVYRYNGNQGTEWVETIRLTDLHSGNSCSVKEFEDDFGKDIVKKKYIYLFKGHTKVAQIPFKSDNINIDYDIMTELLSRVK